MQVTVHRLSKLETGHDGALVGKSELLEEAEVRVLAHVPARGFFSLQDNNHS